MIDILLEDINNFRNLIKNSIFYEIYSNYQSLTLSFNNFKKIIQINEKIFNSKILEINPNIYDNYLEKLVTSQINDEEVLLNDERYLINSIENQNGYKALKETITGIVLATNNAYSNVINKQSKIITTKDVENNNIYLSNSDKIDTLLEIINVNQFFENSKKIIENKLDTLSRDFFDTIEETIEMDWKIGVEIEFFPDEENDHESIKYDIGFNENEYSFQACYVYDMIKLFNKRTKMYKYDEDFFPIKFKCPSLSFLQLRLTPILTFETCADLDLKLDTDKDNLKLTYDFGIQANLGVNIEAGVYFESKVFDISLSVGVDGIMYQGKLGLKFSLDFLKAQLNLNVYIDYLTIAFKFYIKLEIRIVFIKISPYLSYEIKVHGGYDEFPFIYNLNDANQLNKAINYLL